MTKILVIDDEIIIRERLKNLLVLDDFEAYSAENGIEGLEVFEREVPDVIVADIKMPKMDGIEVLKQVKKKKTATEVIFITGHGGVDTAIEAMKEGAFGYIQKPIEYDELKIAIDKAIEKQTMQAKIDIYVRELENSVNEWEITFNCVSDCLSIHDENYNIIKANRAFTDTFGFKPDASGINPCYDLFNCIDDDISQCLHLKTYDGRGACMKEIFYPALNAHFEITASPIFTKDGKFKGSIHIFKDITQRKLYEEKIQASLQEKTLLLREIHHRVKNNMEIISSLIDLHIEEIGDKKTISMCQDMKNRIRSMSLVHKMLYQSDNLSEVNFADYTRELVTDILNSYCVEPSRVALNMDINDVYIAMDTAVPCCLIINELVTNALKHAFTEMTSGELHISLKEVGPTANEKAYELIVRDNGKGIPDGFDISKSSSLGLKLVKILAEYQLKGKIEMNTKGGTEFKLSFRQLQYTKRF
ncbi:response regulator [Candidatus Magnetobacterium casense]|uniref:Response regulator n=1 Tax=Candidatus Magnetobacterium casense TaxID=1455061 RepID=A0ABS6S1Q6_9BACT|nr:response regulator [Candidatus Magnetobacterium casensis]MBV6342338.1 response regulator [Candidatus Magnetobacterium casensis]